MSLHSLCTIKNLLFQKIPEMASSFFFPFPQVNKKLNAKCVYLLLYVFQSPTPSHTWRIFIGLHLKPQFHKRKLSNHGSLMNYDRFL